MAEREEQNPSEGSDKSPLNSGASTAKLLLGVTFPVRTGMAFVAAGSAAHASTAGRVLHQLESRREITAAQKPIPKLQNQVPDTGLSPAEWLLALAKLARTTIHGAARSIQHHLVNQTQKGWRLDTPVVFNDRNEWQWSRAGCRVVSCDKAVTVSVGMHNHDISAVEAVVHDSVLAIRISLGCGRTFRRAEPLPVAMQEAVEGISWDRQEVRIALQEAATP